MGKTGVTKPVALNARVSEADRDYLVSLVGEDGNMSLAVRIALAKAITFDEIFNSRNPLQKAKKFLSGQLGAEMLQRSLTEEGNES